MGAARSSGLGSNARCMRSRRWPQLRAVTAERDALAKAHAQCEALYAALAAQSGLKANAHPAVAQPLLAAGGYSRVHTGVLMGTPRQATSILISVYISIYICIRVYMYIYLYVCVEI